MEIERAIAVAHADEELKKFIEYEMDDMENDFPEDNHFLAINKKAHNRADLCRKKRKEKNSGTLKHNRRRHAIKSDYPCPYNIFNRRKLKENLRGYVAGGYEADMNENDILHA